MQDQFVDMFVVAAQQLPATVAAARRLGLPLTEAELRRNPPILASDNAAPIYRQALNLKKPTDAEQSALTAYTNPGRTEAQRTEARDVLRRHADFLRLARDAAAKPACDFARSHAQGMETPLPEYSWMRTLTRFLAADAVTQMEANDPVGALASIRVGMVIAKHAGEEPFLVPFLVRIAMLAIIDVPFRGLLRRYGTQKDILAQAAEVQSQFAGLHDPRLSFRGNAFYAAWIGDRIRRGENVEVLRLDVKSMLAKVRDPRIVRIFADGMEMRQLEVLVTSLQEMNRKGMTLRDMHATMTRVAEKHQKMVYAAAPDYSYAISGPLSELYPSIIVKAMQAEAIFRVRGTALELLSQRNVTGSFPDRLPQTEGASDPFTDRPLLYQRMGNGFIVYSVSRNGKDDGGSDARDKEKFPLDVVFRYP